MTAKTIKKEWSLDLDFRAPMGETYTRFMEGLKEKTFLGNRCGERTFFPPQPFCDKTLALCGEWLESDGTGKVEAFTVVHERDCTETGSGRNSRPSQFLLPETVPISVAAPLPWLIVYSASVVGLALLSTPYRTPVSG